MKYNINFTDDEIKALIHAASLMLAGEFDGTEAQYVALERVHSKLILAKKSES